MSMSYLTALGIVDAHDGTTLQRDFLTTLARKHRGKRAAMAEAAGVSEATLYRVLAAQALEGATVEIEAQRLATVQDLARLTGRKVFRLSVGTDRRVGITAAGRVFYGKTFDETLSKAVRWARAVEAAEDAGGKLV